MTWHNIFILCHRTHTMEGQSISEPDPDVEAEYMLEIISAGVAEVAAFHTRVGDSDLVTTHLNSGRQQLHEAKQTTYFESMFSHLKAAYHYFDAAKDESEHPDVKMKLETEVMADMWGYIQQHDPEFDTGEQSYSAVKSISTGEDREIPDEFVDNSVESLPEDI